MMNIRYLKLISIKMRLPSCLWHLLGGTYFWGDVIHTLGYSPIYWMIAWLPPEWATVAHNDEAALAFIRNAIIILYAFVRLAPVLWTPISISLKHKQKHRLLCDHIFIYHIFLFKSTRKTSKTVRRRRKSCVFCDQVNKSLIWI